MTEAGANLPAVTVAGIGAAALSCAGTHLLRGPDPVGMRLAVPGPAGTSDPAEGADRASITLRGPTSVLPQKFGCTKGLIRPGRDEGSPFGRGRPLFRGEGR